MTGKTDFVGVFIGGYTKIVQRVAGLAVFPAIFSRVGQPGPVNGFVKLGFSLGMARQTGPGDFHPGFKVLLQCFMPGMIANVVAAA